MKHKTQVSRLLGLAVIAILFLLLFLAANSKSITVEQILSWTPADLVLAAAVILCLYAFKAATIFFPLVVLQIASGLLFPTWVAIIINLLGCLIDMTIPYWVGRRAGERIIPKIQEKYPQSRRIFQEQRKNTLFICFFLRTMSFLPGDILTICLGATQKPFHHNLMGGILGHLPGVLLASLFGSAIQDRSSPVFWISGISMFGLSLVSILLYRVYEKRTED